MIIKGKAMWAYTSKVNDLSKKYQMDITELSQADCKALKAAGVQLKKGDKDKAGWGFYVTAKSVRPVTVVDGKKAPLQAEYIPNGSVVKVSVRPFEYEYKKQKGIALGLQAVMVLELAESAGGLDELEAEEDDFSDAPSEGMPF
jgi:hypothetical protein